MKALRFPRDITRLTLRAPLLAAVRTAPVLHTINWLTRRRPRMLLYHRFGAETTGLALGTAAFEAQLRVIRDRFVPMTVSDLCDALRAGTAPANAVALTIDDGYENVHRYALPLLRAYRVPATFYVTTGFLERALWLWPDTISYALQHTTRTAIEWSDGRQERTLRLDSSMARPYVWQTLTDHVATLPSTEVRGFLAHVLARLEVCLPAAPVGDYAPITWEQLKEFAAAGIEIGDHTWSHPWLTRCTPEEVAYEIRHSKAILEARLGGAVRSFAYPHGAYTPAIRQAVRDAGFANAVSGTGGPTDDWGDCYSVPRRSHGGAALRFQTTVFGVYELASLIGFPM